MGWWETSPSGASFTRNDGPEMLWGDGPADILDDAIDAIVKEFERSLERRPTRAEIEAGLRFSLSIYKDEVNA